MQNFGRGEEITLAIASGKRIFLRDGRRTWDETVSSGELNKNWETLSVAKKISEGGSYTGAKAFRIGVKQEGKYFLKIARIEKDFMKKEEEKEMWREV